MAGTGKTPPRLQAAIECARVACVNTAMHCSRDFSANRTKVVVPMLYIQELFRDVTRGFAALTLSALLGMIIHMTAPGGHHRGLFPTPQHIR